MYLDHAQPKNLHVNKFLGYAGADGQGNSLCACACMCNFFGKCPRVLASPNIPGSPLQPRLPLHSFMWWSLRTSW